MRRDYEEARERLLAAGWEPRIRGGLLLCRKPGGRGRWFLKEKKEERGEDKR